MKKLICSILSLYQFFKEDLSNIPTFHDRIKQKESFLTDIEFSKEDVKIMLSFLDISKSFGPDKFYPRILKELSNELSEPLFLLFSKSLIDGVLPKIWKDAHVTPVYKKGEKCSPGNYRPISLTSVIYKTLEKLIRNAIVNHMEKNSLFNKSQQRFMKTKSCMTQLLETLEEWTDLLDQNFSIDVIYIWIFKRHSIPYLTKDCSQKFMHTE